jgi:hypothetical protein
MAETRETRPKPLTPPRANSASRERRPPHGRIDGPRVERSGHRRGLRLERHRAGRQSVPSRG